MKIGVLPCQGACNVGMMTNKVALQFVDNENINMVCPLGLPLGIKSMIDKAAANDKHIAINGCPLKCASKAYDAAGIRDYEEVTITQEFDIQKNKNYNDETNMEQVKERVGTLISQMARTGK